MKGIAKVDKLGTFLILLDERATNYLVLVVPKKLDTMKIGM